MSLLMSIYKKFGHGVMVINRYYY